MHYLINFFLDGFQFFHHLVVGLLGQLQLLLCVFFLTLDLNLGT